MFNSDSTEISFAFFVAFALFVITILIVLLLRYSGMLF